MIGGFYFYCIFAVVVNNGIMVGRYVKSVVAIFFATLVKIKNKINI
jgi:hypothetical protein